MLLPTIINAYFRVGQPRVKSLSQMFVDTRFFLGLANVKPLKQSLQHISSSHLSFTLLFNPYYLGRGLAMSTLRNMLNLKKSSNINIQHCSAIFLTHQKKCFQFGQLQKLAMQCSKFKCRGYPLVV